MPAPIAQFDVEMALGAETWTNRYLTSVLPSGPSSGGIVTALVAAHRALLGTPCTVTRVRHATLAPDDADYTITAVNLAGTRVVVVGDMLPLFCTVRFDFTPAAGRPSRKYFRGALAEGDITGSTLTSAFQSGPCAAYISAILAIDEIVDPQGDTLLSGNVLPPVQMRQLRRGSRRRSTPVLG